MDDESSASMDRFLTNLGGDESFSSGIWTSPSSDKSLHLVEEETSLLIVRNTFLELCRLAVVPDRFMSAPPTFPSLDSTTLMVRNIPTRTTADNFMRSCELNDTQIDFFYLPIDFKTRKNLGYSFINFVSSEFAKEFILKFNEKQFVFCATSEKKLAITYSNRQGYISNVKVFTETKLLDTWPLEYRPLAKFNDKLLPLDSSLLAIFS